MIENKSYYAYGVTITNGRITGGILRTQAEEVEATQRSRIDTLEAALTMVRWSIAFWGEHASPAEFWERDLASDLAKVDAAHRQGADMTDAGWQPIETIPKGEPDEWGDREGPIVLVWIPNHGIPWVARWVEDGGERGRISSMYSEAMGSWSVTLDDHRPQYHPTMWRPLPAPPKEPT